MSDNTVKIDLDAIEKAAKAATQGEWSYDSFRMGGVVRGGPIQHWVNGSGQSQIAMSTGAEWMEPGELNANAAHMASSSPAVVLELIRRCRAAEALVNARIEVIPTDTRVLAIFADIKPEHRDIAEEFTNCIQRRTSSWTLVAYFNTDASIEALSVEAMAEAGWVRALKEDV